MSEMMSLSLCCFGLVRNVLVGDLGLLLFSPFPRALSQQCLAKHLHNIKFKIYISVKIGNMDEINFGIFFFAKREKL